MQRASDLRDDAMTPENLHAGALATAFVAATLPAGTAQAAMETEEGRLAFDELRTFADVFNQIRQGYVEEIDDSTLLEYAIEGMLTGLDPHSVYLTRDAFEDLQTTTSGEFRSSARVVALSHLDQETETDRKT